MPIDDFDPPETTDTSIARYFMIARRDDGVHVGILDHDGDAQRLSETLQWDIVSTHAIEFDRDRGRPGFKDHSVADRHRVIDLVCKMADRDLSEGWDHMHVIQNLIGQAYDAGYAAARAGTKLRFLLVRHHDDGRVHGMLWWGPTVPQSHGEVVGEVPLDFGAGARDGEQTRTLQAFAALGDVAQETLDRVFTAGLQARQPEPPPLPAPTSTEQRARKKRSKPKKTKSVRRKRP